MPLRRKIALATAAALVGPLLGAVVTVIPAEAGTKPAWTKNCTALNKKYVHGVGKKNAKDKTSAGQAVTNFKKSDSIYNKAMSYNKGLDRDKDKVACEKA